MSGKYCGNILACTLFFWYIAFIELSYAHPVENNVDNSPFSEQILIFQSIIGGSVVDILSIWKQSLPLLENTMTQVVYDTTIMSIAPISFENGVLTLKTDIDFYKPSIEKRYLSEITRCIRSVSGINDMEVRIVSPEDFDETNLIRRKNYDRTNLRPRYNFETFVKGKCNELAYAAAESIAANPGQTDYNPLFLYGGVGLGKTHLMHSIGNHVVDKFPNLKVLYVTSEGFTNDFVTAIREKNTEAFMKKYRSLDVLLMDDVQFLEKKEGTQEELFHTFNI